MELNLNCVDKGREEPGAIDCIALEVNTEYTPSNKSYGHHLPLCFESQQALLIFSQQGDLQLEYMQMRMLHERITIFAC